jgi:hypothetical protein
VEADQAQHRKALLDRTAPLLGLFLSVGLAVFLAALLTVYSGRLTVLANNSGARRTNHVITHWLNEGFFHYRGLMVTSPPGQPLTIYSHSGTRLITGFLLEKIYVAAFGHYSWRLIALHNLLVSLLLSALLGLLAFRLVRRIGLDPLLAFAAGASVVIVIFTFPENLELYYEISGQAWWLLFATIFLLIEERTLDGGRTVAPSIAQAAAIVLMAGAERIATLAFLAAMVVPFVLLERERGAWRRLLFVAVVPYLAMLALYGGQMRGLQARFPAAKVTGTPVLSRTGLDGVTLYYGDHLDIARRRSVARGNWPEASRPYMFNWTSVFFLGSIAALAVMAAYVGRRAPRFAAEVLIVLVGSWLVYAAVFSQAVMIHPYLYDVMLFSPLALALFGIVPAIAESLTGRTGAIVLVVMFCAFWYACFQLRLFAVRYPMPSPPTQTSAAPPVHLPPLLLRRPSRAAVAEDPRHDVDLLLHRRLVDVHRAGDLLGRLRRGDHRDDHAAEALAEDELDGVALADGGGGLDALAVQLHVAALAGVGGIGAVLDQADVFEPEVDSHCL